MSNDVVKAALRGATTLLLWAFVGCCGTDKADERDMVVSVCRTCGTNWVSEGQGLSPAIENCPMCPMSVEEFEAIKRAIKEKELIKRHE